MGAFLFFCFITVAVAAYFISLQLKKYRQPIVFVPLAKKHQNFLAQEVNFYNALSTQDKLAFEQRIQEFLAATTITAVKTTIVYEDELLIAASAIIPIFSFPHWKYSNLQEVLVYPDRFNAKFQAEGEGRSILGMVGTGYMNGKMILSKKAIHDGFRNTTDKQNTPLHEFVHLIDKMDGTVDGIPKVLLDNQYILPWLDLMAKKIDEIIDDKSDIRPYGGTSEIEFFAVASEYFFERPKLLKSKHPKLYNYLEQIFGNDMTQLNLRAKKVEIGRNSPCSCGSGKKYKRCCGF